MRKQTNIVCLDSQIVSWALKPELQKDKSLSINANHFLDYLSISNKKIVLPTPILTELTWYANEIKRANVIQKISRRFIVKPFDLKASLICGDILNQYSKNPNFQDIKKEIGKKKIKYDAMIAAVAIANDCECIYTEDSDYKIVKDIIEIRNMPIIERQMSIFENFPKEDESDEHPF